MDKKKLSETDIITKFIMPAVQGSDWDLMSQTRQEVKLRDGVRGQLSVRKTVKSADIVLYHKPNMPLAVIEAKANKHDIAKADELMVLCEELKARISDAQTAQIHLADAVVEQVLN